MEYCKRMAVSVGLIGFLLCYSTGFSQQATPTPKSRLSPQKLIGSFYSDLENMKGKRAAEIPMESLDSSAKFAISDYDGKVLLLQFWAVNCGPCRIEAPKITRLYTKYKDSELVVLYLSFDEVELQKKFLAQYHVQGEKARIKTEKLAKPYASPIVPRGILIDRRGLIEDGWLGTLNPEEIQLKILASLSEK